MGWPVVALGEVVRHRKEFDYRCSSELVALFLRETKMRPIPKPRFAVPGSNASPWHRPPKAR